jgi:hypothetical protein
MRQGIGPSRSSRAISEACRVAGTDSAASDGRAAEIVRSGENLAADLEPGSLGPGNGVVSLAEAVVPRAPVRRFKPYPACKHSGVEWLGEIPAHWQATRLKTLARLRAGTVITSDKIEPEGDYPVFGGNGLRGYTSSYTHDGELPLVGTPVSTPLPTTSLAPVPQASRSSASGSFRQRRGSRNRASTPEAKEATRIAGRVHKGKGRV